MIVAIGRSYEALFGGDMLPMREVVVLIANICTRNAVKFDTQILDFVHL